MLFIGIDVASDKHDAVITSLYGEIITEPFTITNDLEGFKKLRKEILSHTESRHEVHIGIEETGIYSKNICEFLALCDFNVYMINPVLTSNSRKSQSVRLTKTDPIDALAICRYVEFNLKRLNSYTPSLYTFNEIKSLSRARLDIQSRLIKAKTEWARLLDITFPEFKKSYNHQSKWVYKLFYNYSTTAKIAKMHTNTLVSILAIKSDRFIAANHIKKIAKNTIGQVSRSNTFLINNTISDINHYAKQMNELEKEIETLVTEHFSNILTIPGVGPITAGLIIGEIGDINRFNSPSALVAYTGLDPIVYESGKFKAKRVTISKRGSKYLRTAIFTSTKFACINPNVKDNKFRQKYLKKRSQGKHHNSAICHVTKNMTNLIFSLLHTGTKYSYDY
ncbi:IS110 family transposase [Clostridiaceae bacterium HSG29]|nr:IS110 family transposase [Clostridiaceae bacterium HSG29]